MHHTLLLLCGFVHACLEHSGPESVFHNWATHKRICQGMFYDGYRILSSKRLSCTYCTVSTNRLSDGFSTLP